ncbi:hypothetical protein KW796_00470 [Candidatus Parcubacteria bacterium]|nr:hypothetical protein [Candidatus Parcubacteria bacterium]
MPVANDFGVVTMGRLARRLAEAGWEPEDLESLTPEMARRFLDVHHELAEVRPMDRIVCRVRVDRSRTPRQALSYYKGNAIITSAVDSMPRGEGEEVDVIFYRLSSEMSDEYIEEAYGHEHKTDPYAVLAVHQLKPDFFHAHPGGTYWKDVAGNWCHLMITGRRSSQYLYAEQGNAGIGWASDVWLGFVRK